MDALLTPSGGAQAREVSGQVQGRPYLTESDTANAIKRRLVIIEDFGPASLIPLSDKAGRTWRGLLEDARADGTKTASPDPDGFEIFYLASLYFGTQSSSGERSVPQLVTEILAIVLPPVGAAATGLQSLLVGRRLSRSYADRALMLTGLAEAFLKLQPQFTTGGPPREEHEFQFNVWCSAPKKHSPANCFSGGC